MQAALMKSPSSNESFSSQVSWLCESLTIKKVRMSHTHVSDIFCVCYPAAIGLWVGDSALSHLIAHTATKPFALSQRAH